MYPIFDRNGNQIHAGDTVKFKDYYDYRYHKYIETEGTVSSIDQYGTIYVNIPDPYRTAGRDGFSHEVKKHPFFTEFKWGDGKGDRRVTCFNRSDMDSKIVWMEIINN